MNGILIYRKEDADRNIGFIQSLLKSATIHKLNLTLVYVEDLQWGIKNGTPFLFHPFNYLTPIHFAIVRTIQPLLTNHLELLGIRCFNSSRVSTICNDKAFSHQIAASLGIPMLNTWFIENNQVNLDHLEIDFPLILKQVDGRGGKEVYKVESLAEIKTKLNDKPSKRFILQEMCNNPGQDLRVFVMGKQIIGSVLRKSTTSFKANYTLGGEALPYELSNQNKAIVDKIVECLQPDFIGIDFLINKNGELLFNEMEDVVGCRTLYATTNLDVADLYIQHIKQG